MYKVGSFQLRIVKLLKKNYFKKFVEEPDFVELSTQAKHLRFWILYDDYLNDSPQYYCQFLYSQFTKV